MDWQISGDLTAYRQSIEKRIADAVRAEREACAKIAADYAVRAETRGVSWADHQVAGDVIAAKIRSRD